MNQLANSPAPSGTRLSRRGVDLLLALGIGTVSVAVLALITPLLREDGLVLEQPQLTVLMVLVGAQSLAVAWWRSRPAVALVLVSLAQVLIIVTAVDLSFRGVATMLVAFSVGARFPLRSALLLLVPAIVAESVAGGVAKAVGSGDWLLNTLNHGASAGLGYLLAMVIGIAVSARTENTRLLRERAARHQDRQLEAAIAEERRRIAGELHDVAAHHLSGMVVQAAAVERMVDRDPEGARAGAVHLRRQGKETLNGLRSVVGLLRDEGDMAPVAGLDDLPDLVDATRALGVDVQLHRSGQPPRLAPLVGAAIYRVAQQALSNAVQHAPGAAVRVQLRAADGQLALEVTNGPGTPGTAAGTPGSADPEPLGTGGTGLVVMRERVTLIGGRLEAGPSADGGWRVHLTLPLPEAEEEQR